MRKLKKIMGLLMALVMLFGAAAPVFAQGNSSLSVRNTGNTTHTFELYQIFKGDVSGEEKSLKLANIQWGSGVKDPEGDASEKAESLKSVENAENFAKEISKKVRR